MTADWKELKRHPISAEYKDIGGDEWARFTRFLKIHGIVGGRKIMLHEGMVLDGWQLKRACVELGIEPDFGTLPEGADPRVYVEAYNDQRRHETHEERQERILRVAAARTHGKSQQAIAEEEGISRKRVRDDLEEAGRQGVRSCPVKQEVQGKDGKTYPPNRPGVLCRHCEHRSKVGKPLIPDCPECKALRKILPAPKAPPKPAADPKPAVDDAGRVVPQRLVPVFRAIRVFDETMKLLNACSKGFSEIERGPAKEAKPLNPEAHYRKFYPTFKAARELLKRLRPSLVCAKCDGDGCDWCRYKGWVTVEEAERPEVGS